MKKFKYLALALVAIGFVSCEDKFTEEPINPDAEQEFVVKKITLEAKKGNDDATRVYIGSANQSGTIYYWHETDEIGVFALNTGSTMKNYEAKINQLNEGNKNLARFSSYLNYAPNNNENADLFIYWPYNSSNVVADADAVVSTYLNERGVQIRTKSQQDQLVYGTEFGTMDHPSVNISKYGAAYDMTTCDNTGAGSFELQHQTAYLQFNAWGVVGQAGSGDYGNGEFEVAKMVVRLGKISGSISNGTLADDATFTSVKIAGNFTYNVPKYNKGKVSYKDVALLSGGGDDYVAVTLAEPQQLLNSSKVPVFAVVNAANITADNVNAIEATITLNKKNTEGTVIGTFTRTRYISLGGNVIKGGDFYNISYKVNDPTIQNVELDAEGNSNCYIISYPGTYTFDVSFPGNGQLPANAEFSNLGLPSSGKFFTDPTGYAVDWLWASGESFETAGGVDGVVTVGMDENKGELVVKPQGTSELSGNLVVALHKKGDKTIIWTWHIWFCKPVLQHYNFPNTRESINLNNEDWHMFDRNLGAETNELGEVTSYGLYYQLGRHVPFITPKNNGTWPTNAQTTFVNSYFGQSWGVGSLTLQNTYSNPMTMNTGSTIGTSSSSNIYTYAWVANEQPATQNSKTLLDPCPLGYKLPTTREWDNLKNNEFEASSPVAKGSGVFGYGAPYSTSSYTNYRVAHSSWGGTYYDPDMNSEANIKKYGNVADSLNTRIATNNWFKSDDSGREYSIVKFAGADNLSTPLTTYFPNSGVLTPSNRSATSSNINNHFAVWAAGRLNDAETAYDYHWFGPKYKGDFYYSDNTALGWFCYMPWHSNSSPYGVTRDNSPLGVEIQSGVRTASPTKAVPVRCIREYNSTETAE